MNSNSGYHDCPCRDCFEVAIGRDGAPNLCHECEGAGCDATGESECEVERIDEELDAELATVRERFARDRHEAKLDRRARVRPFGRNDI